jgi:hypothetical protein
MRLVLLPANTTRWTRGNFMAKFAIGDAVAQGKTSTGEIVAIFTTVDGVLRYAIEHEGALQFFLETELVRLQPETA